MASDDATLTAAAVAIHDADCPDTTCSGSALGHCYRLARAALAAAEPVIRRDERDQCIQMAEQDAAHADLMVASDEARIVGEVLRNFADRLRGDRS
jgi:hypothetical protein